MSQSALQRLSTVPWFLVSAPEIRPRDLLRDELSQIIEASVQDYPLTLIEAPSGFGKTTSLALWSKHREAPTAWMTLGRDSKSTAQLLTYLMSSLLRLYPESPELKSILVQLQDGSADLQSAIGSIIDAMPGDAQTTIIVDEAQETSREALKALIVPLGHYSRGRLRFVMSATQSLTRWLTKEIANGQAWHIPGTEFLFTPDEVAEFVSQHTGPASQIADQLWQETGGWPVAVHLLVQVGADSHTPADLQAHISPSILTDYINSEVLASLRPELREFILDAAVCERLTPELVSHITDNPLAVSLLEECRRHGLFLDRLNQDGGDTLYRWHTTFARSCREIAEHTDPARFRHIHRRAAEWMSDQFPAEAIHHAIETGDTSFTLKLVEDIWLQLITNGSSAVLEERCDQLPKSIQGSASILSIRAVCRNLAGDDDSARMLRKRSNAALATMRGDEAERAAITRTFARLMVIADHSELESALDEAERILAQAQLSQSQYIHGSFIAGWTRIRLRSKPEQAIKLLTATAESAAGAGFHAVARRASATSAFALGFAGNLSTARQILDGLPAVLESHGYDPFDGSMNYWSSLFISYWQGDLPRAMADARKLDSVGGPASSNAGMGRIYFACTAALMGQDSLDEADQLLDKVSDDVEHGIPWPAYKAVAKASVHWARGERTAAVEALDVLWDHTAITTTLVMAADLWRRLGYPERALRVIAQVDTSLLVSYTTVSIGFTQAVIAWDRRNSGQAHRLLENCLDTAVPESISAPFIRLDSSARGLLNDHLGSGTRHEKFIIQKLTEDSSSSSNPQAVPQPLSSRESEVFSYLATSMTAIEIAEALFLSPATVRTHQRSIYRKLNVTNRREAVRVGTRIQSS